MTTTHSPETGAINRRRHAWKLLTMYEPQRCIADSCQGSESKMREIDSFPLPSTSLSASLFSLHFLSSLPFPSFYPPSPSLSCPFSLLPPKSCYGDLGECCYKAPQKPQWGSGRSPVNTAYVMNLSSEIADAPSERFFVVGTLRETNVENELLRYRLTTRTHLSDSTFRCSALSVWKALVKFSRNGPERRSATCLAFHYLKLPFHHLKLSFHHLAMPYCIFWSVNFRENHYNCCHQRSDFKA